MKKIIVPALVLLMGCKNNADNNLEYKEELKKPLNEISGLTFDGHSLWAITDKPKAVVFKLDDRGKVEQEISIKNVDAVDVEAVTADSNYVYIGDLGDNEGGRDERQIIKANKKQLGSKPVDVTTAEVITFTFPGNAGADKKKNNNYDCEAFLSYGDSLYVFTKRREDLRCDIYSIPKTPGTYEANLISSFDTKGLVTDAAINNQQNEVALIGYTKGHRFPFLLFFTGFRGSDFFSGTSQRIELADKPWDWQLESICYGEKDLLYFACEQTKEVKSTLYAVKRSAVPKLNKKEVKY